MISGMQDVKLKEHLDLNTSKLTDYKLVKDEIREYLMAKKQWVSVIGQSSSQKQDYDAMEVGALHPGATCTLSLSARAYPGGCLMDLYAA